MHQKMIAAFFVASSASAAYAQSVQSFDFEAPGNFGASTQLRNAGNFEGIGSPGREITGTFAYADQKDAPITITLTDLDDHDSIDIDFTLALIDSWDGERPNQSWAPDFISVLVDGQEVFRESFSNFSGDIWAPSYSRDERVAFGNFFGNSGWDDAVYNISITDIAHNAPTANIQILATGSGYESGGNEPFAVDNFEVTALPAPSSIALVGLAAAGTRRRR